MLPDLADFEQVEVVGRLLEDLKTLGVRLHHAVLDAVVDHLDEVAGAVRTAQTVAALRRQVDGRLDPRGASGAPPAMIE